MISSFLLCTTLVTLNLAHPTPVGYHGKAIGPRPGRPLTAQGESTKTLSSPFGIGLDLQDTLKTIQRTPDYKSAVIHGVQDKPFPGYGKKVSQMKIEQENAVKNKAPLPHPHAQPLRDHEPMESKSARPLNAKQSTKTTQQVRPPTISKERKLAVSRFSPHYTPPSHLKATPQTVDNRANSHKVQPVHSTETSRQVKILQRPEKGKEVKSQVSPHPSPASQHQQGASFNPTTKLAVAIPTAPAEEDAKIAEVKPSRDVSPVHQHMEHSSNVKDKAQEEFRPAEMKSSSKGKDKRVKIPMKTQFKLPKNAPRGGGKESAASSSTQNEWLPNSRPTGVEAKKLHKPALKVDDPYFGSLEKHEREAALRLLRKHREGQKTYINREISVLKVAGGKEPSAGALLDLAVSQQMKDKLYDLGPLDELKNKALSMGKKKNDNKSTSGAIVPTTANPAPTEAQGSGHRIVYRTAGNMYKMDQDQRGGPHSADQLSKDVRTGFIAGLHGKSHQHDSHLHENTKASGGKISAPEAHQQQDDVSQEQVKGLGKATALRPLHHSTQDEGSA